MTNLADLTAQKDYFKLQYVEFLEMICRVAKLHWEDRKLEKVPMENGEYPLGIEFEVQDVL